MSRIEEFECRVENDGILQLSGGVFKDHEVTFLGVKGMRKQNTTPAEYCEKMGSLHNVTAEEYADQILRIMSSPSKIVIGECQSCFEFLLEGEGHACDGRSI